MAGRPRVNEYRVAFRREALLQLEELYDYIADSGSPRHATRYTESIVGFSEELGTFPRRGTVRDDIRPGMRTIGYGTRVIVAFAILDGVMAILGIFYGGCDFETILTTSDSIPE